MQINYISIQRSDLKEGNVTIKVEGQLKIVCTKTLTNTQYAGYYSKNKKMFSGN